MPAYDVITETEMRSKNWHPDSTPAPKIREAYEKMLSPIDKTMTLSKLLQMCEGEKRVWFEEQRRIYDTVNNPIGRNTRKNLAPRMHGTGVLAEETLDPAIFAAGIVWYRLVCLDQWTEVLSSFAPRQRLNMSPQELQKLANDHNYL